MANQQFAGLAVLVAITFMLLALAACANSERPAETFGPVVIAPIEPPPGSAEFHGARIGGDALRSRLPSDG